MARVSRFRSDDARARYLAAYDSALARCRVPLSDDNVDTPFGTTHVLLAGDAERPPLVALHGKSVSATMWVAHLEALTATRRVAMVDTIGDMGRSVATAALRSR